MVFLCIASIVLSSIALHGIALHGIAWHCIAFDYLLSSPRAKRAGPKGLRAESARAVTGRRCPHSGVG